ncbi:family 78 glycoside hydrolase catalytic domain [Mucilaginibacter sp. CAU 1740]|uniref:family 78 glycoside hydrolase catalytic domain n=1 Tax=Mucilaginibacter sp. CAU 1740 TaxID=3140365 RepID=UPI00325BA583
MCKKVCTRVILLLFSYLPITVAQAQKAPPVPPPFRVDNLVCEYKINPISVDEANPRLGWKLLTRDRNIQQTAYEVRVGSNAVSLLKGKDLIWTSGKVTSNESLHVPYGGPMLASRQKVYWQVRIWNNRQQVTPWSMVNSWKMGLLKPSDWSAKWIEDNYLSDTTGGPSPMFRKTFKLDHKVRAAHLYITAHGLYEAQFNGKRIGNDYFAPGWTSYNKRLQYQVYDVTADLLKGDNAVGVTLGDGWYRGYTYNRKKDVYGSKLGLLFQLEIVYTNGKRVLINSDKTWKVAYGPIRSSSFFDGEVYDARKEKKGWSTIAYKDAAWDSVRTDTVKENLVAMFGPPVRKHEMFKPLKVFTTPAGEKVVDFGQNLVGWVQFKFKAKAGDSVKLFHAEVLDQQGNFYTKNLRTAKQENTYVFKGDSVETFEPHFTFQGFRYLKIVGYNGPIDSTSVAAFALYSDMAQTGSFSTSNPLINQLQHNIQWGQKGNFIDVPTDCPQRDERMGWTGDAQAFSRTATFNMDVAGFFTKWLKDLSADQLKNGAVPYVIPDVLLDKSLSAASGWSDVATIAPWNIYLAYGDKKVLEDQYASMTAWVGYITAHTRAGLWDTGNHFGDWLFYAGTDYADGAALTDKNLIAQAFYAYSTQLVINTANILGKQDDVKKYTALLADIKKAFLAEYVTPNGRMISGTQTSYVLALNFDLLPENLRASAAKRLVDNIEDYDEHITTGFLGTPYICHVLSRFGHTDVAYDLLMKESYPSWLYPVKNGATTIWERWDGIKPNGTFEDPEMNSFNHYAYGAIGDWMYRVVAGISTDEGDPGFHKINIFPHPGGKLTNAHAELETLYGKVKSAWSIDNGIFTLDVIVPPNTSAVVTLPAVDGPVTEGNADITTSKDITNIKPATGSDLQMDIGSGTYQFKYILKTHKKNS